MLVTKIGRVCTKCVSYTRSTTSAARGPEVRIGMKRLRERSNVTGSRSSKMLQAAEMQAGGQAGGDDGKPWGERRPQSF